jgi:hypothetical protein
VQRRSVQQGWPAAPQGSHTPLVVLHTPPDRQDPSQHGRPTSPQSRQLPWRQVVPEGQRGIPSQQTFPTGPQGRQRLLAGSPPLDTEQTNPGVTQVGGVPGWPAQQG